MIAAIGKDAIMRGKLIAVLLASATAACTTPNNGPADRGVASVNEPVLTRSNYVVDLAAPGGVLAPDEMGRLDAWFHSLELGYGDSIFVDGAYAEGARAQVAQVASNYGMMVLPSAPVTAGMVAPGSIRVVVSRTRAEVPGCPNWSVPSQPNFSNRTMSNFGCALNSNFTAMVANPEDLFHGREGTGVGDAMTAAKAVGAYRNAEPTGTQGLKDISTKEGK
ncbi:MAG TPA: CpaD family pilus assembly lipoprotein [Sphingomicrobium sp.]|nr:CpaD family pilus assembly lipoprotein [Sphingomicrobium sp.]